MSNAYVAYTAPQHSPATAATVINLAADYLHACNEYAAGNGSQEEAIDCLRQIASYASDMLNGDE